MMEQGLAGQGQDPQRAMIDKIKEALVSGMNPDELVAQGDPQELVQIAMQELQAEMQQSPSMGAQTAGGLAMSQGPAPLV